MPAPLVIAAHGTRSERGVATTRELATAVAAARSDTPVELAFLDVASPTLRDVLQRLDGPAVVVPLLLSAGYHVTTDIPAIAADFPGASVAAHLGPDPLVIGAVADRLTQAAPDLDGRTVLLAAVASSRASARGEVDLAAARLAERLGRPVDVLPLDGQLRVRAQELPPGVAVATYLLAEGGFLDTLGQALAGRGVVADPVGVHAALVQLVWSRYDDARSSSPTEAPTGRG